MRPRAARPWLLVLGLLWGAVLIGVGVVAVAAALAPRERPAYYAEAQARDGVLVYAQHCASCHGPDLAGGAAPALRGDAFWDRWEGASVAELSRYVRRNMPPGRAGALSREAYGDVLAYLLHRNGLPAGGVALAPDAARLAELPLRPDLATGSGGDLAPATTGAARFLLGRLLRRSGDAPERPTSTMRTALQEDAPAGPEEGGAPPAAAREGAPAAAPSAVAGRTGDLRLTVLPPPAEVVLRATGGLERAFGAGSRVVGGLEPGRYTVVARRDGVVLEQSIEIAAGEVAEAELLFGGTEPASAAAPASPPRDAIAGVTLDGGTIYARRCLACHGPGGGGGLGPALAENERLEDEAWMLRRILRGGLGMPSFAGVLSAPEVAAVASFVRTHFGNPYEPVEVETVRVVREALPEARLERAVGPDLALASLGEQRYVALCSACHGLQGGGDVGPPLAGDPRLADEQLVITTLLYGRGMMPAFSLHSDREIAAVASYVRTSWGNPYDPVAAERVAPYRPGADAADGPREGRRDADPQ